MDPSAHKVTPWQYCLGVTVSDQNGDELLSDGDVADEVGVSAQTVRRWRYDGDLPYVRFGYRTVRVRRSDLREMIWSRRRDGGFVVSNDAVDTGTGREESPIPAKRPRRSTKR